MATPMTYSSWETSSRYYFFRTISTFSKVYILLTLSFIPFVAAANEWSASTGRVNDIRSGNTLSGAWVVQTWEVSGNEHPACSKVEVSRSDGAGIFSVSPRPFSLVSAVLAEREQPPVVYSPRRVAVAYWTLPDAALAKLPQGVEIPMSALGLMLGEMPDFAKNRLYPKSVATGVWDVNLVTDPRPAAERIKFLLTWTNIGTCAEAFRRSPGAQGLFSEILSEAVSLSATSNIDDLGRLCYGFYPELLYGTDASGALGRTTGRDFCEAFSKSRQ